MLFNFKLVPVREITPWGTPPKLSLSWFGLTDGYYFMQVGTDTLFEYTDEIVRHRNEHYPGSTANNYVDYQVVRLWEDVLQMLPAVLTPLPDRLQARLFYEWKDIADRWLDAMEEHHHANDADVDLYYDAICWIRERQLPTNYLAQGPRIWMWSTDTRVHICWDNTAAQIDGVLRWSAQSGCHSMPREEFVAEIKRFNAELIGQMEVRVKEITTDWDRPDIRIDIAGLQREHIQRASELEKVLRAGCQPVEWSRVFSALDEITRVQESHDRT
jgi:hypothetical protein